MEYDDAWESTAWDVKTDDGPWRRAHAEYANVLNKLVKHQDAESLARYWQEIGARLSNFSVKKAYAMGCGSWWFELEHFNGERMMYARAVLDESFECIVSNTHCLFVQAGTQRSFHYSVDAVKDMTWKQMMVTLSEEVKSIKRCHDAGCDVAIKYKGEPVKSMQKIKNAIQLSHKKRKVTKK